MWFPEFHRLSIEEHHGFVLQPSKQLFISMNLVKQCLYSLKMAGGEKRKENKQAKKGPNGEITC